MSEKKRFEIGRATDFTECRIAPYPQPCPSAYQLEGSDDWYVDVGTIEDLMALIAEGKAPLYVNRCKIEFMDNPWPMY